MRKPHKRWIALAGAATVSLAAFGTAAAPAAANDLPSLSQLLVQQNQSKYIIDGFEVGSLAPGLEHYGTSSETHSDRDGSRTSHIAWVRGWGDIQAKVSVFRSTGLTRLDAVRDTHYSHLDSEELKTVTVNGKRGYLSDSTGDVFWLDGDGTAIAVFLAPERWETGELLSMAESIVPRRAAAMTTTGDAAADSGDTDRSNTGRPMMRGTADSSRPAGEADEGELTDEQVKAIERCLIDEVGTMPGAIWDQSIEFSPGNSVTWNSGLWSLVQGPIRDSAVSQCAQRLGVEESRVEEVLADLSASPRPSGGGGGYPSLWVLGAWL